MQGEIVQASIKVSYTLAPNQTSYIARVKGKQPVKICAANTENEPCFATTALKPCIAAICLSRPDLLSTSQSDYTLAALDAEETYQARKSKQDAVQRGIVCSPIKGAGQDKIWEGKGMLSWVLSENKDAADSEASTVGGKWCPFSSSLTVTVQLTERPSITKSLFFDSIRGISPAINSASISPSLGIDKTPVLEEQPSLSAPASFAINVIEPTPSRQTFEGPASLPHRASSSPLAQSTSKLAAAPSLTTAAANSGVDKAQIATLLEKLIPQLAAGNLPDVEREAVEATVKTLLGYLSSTDPGILQQKKIASPHRGLCINSLDNWLSSVASDPVSATSPAASATSTQSPPISSSRTKRKHLESNHLAAPVKTIKLPRVKYDAVGCSNCGIHNTVTWRKSKKGTGSRTCNACGIYFNTVGQHRPVTDEMRQLAKDHTAHDDSLHLVLPPVPESRKKQRLNTLPIMSDESDQRLAKKKSMLAVKDGNVLPPDFVLQASPRSALDRIMSDSSQPDRKSIIGKRPKARPLLYPKNDTNDDIFALKNTLLSSKIFAAQPEAGLASPKSELGTNMLHGMFESAPWFKKGGSSVTSTSRRSALTSEVGSEMELDVSVPPSSPPTHSSYAAFGFSLSDTAASPDRPAEQSQALEASLEKGFVWTEEAIATLSNALSAPGGLDSLVQDPGTANSQNSQFSIEMDDRTLEDIFGSFLSNADSPASVSSNQPLLDVGSVVDVNLAVANAIWLDQVSTQFAVASSKHPASSLLGSHVDTGHSI